MNNKETTDLILDSIQSIKTERTQTTKKWSEEIPAKLTIIMPGLLFIIFFFQVNNNISLLEILAWIAFYISPILMAVLLNFLLNKGN